MNKSQIIFDSNDFTKMKEIMKEYGNCEFPFYGANQDGADIEIHVSPSSITTKTYQNNGWLRVMYYELIDGSICVSETYEGRWQ